jgi:hypothetical protein
VNTMTARRRCSAATAPGGVPSIEAFIGVPDLSLPAARLVVSTR